MWGEILVCKHHHGHYIVPRTEDECVSISSDQLWKERLTTPAYRVGEAASYAKISPQTVSAWHKKEAKRRNLLSEKIGGDGLSFVQLIEIAVVAEMRRAGVKLKEIAIARAYFEKTTGLKYPFAQLRFKTDGADVLHDFEDPSGQVVEDTLIAANHSGQHVWRDMLAKRLREFNYDSDGAVIQWKVAGEDKSVMIDPRLAFGAPQVEGVRTEVLKRRWFSGEEIDELADDFGISSSLVVEALLFEGIDSGSARISKWIH